ncbi:MULTISPECIES: DUF2256 domain-containing protein [unclassified Microbacterium]|uniref:DUF2256 domain-containing protein n=1 Tax=unclassified Microbacterium TaxID=2609290 RepID=UPI003746AA8D
MAQPVRESKPCAQCGRPFDNRKRWSTRAQWDEVKYCSSRCRAAAAHDRRTA